MHSQNDIIQRGRVKMRSWADRDVRTVKISQIAIATHLKHRATDVSVIHETRRMSANASRNTCKRARQVEKSLMISLQLAAPTNMKHFKLLATKYIEWKEATHVPYASTQRLVTEIDTRAYVHACDGTIVHQEEQYLCMRSRMSILENIR